MRILTRSVSEGRNATDIADEAPRLRFGFVCVGLQNEVVELR